MDVVRLALEGRLASRVGGASLAVVVVLVFWVGAERQADGPGHSGGREIAQVFSARSKHSNRVVATVRDVEIALLVEGQAGGGVQRGGWGVPQSGCVSRALAKL